MQKPEYSSTQALITSQRISHDAHDLVYVLTLRDERRRDNARITSRFDVHAIGVKLLLEVHSAHARRTIGRQIETTEQAVPAHIGDEFFVL